ncbi:hypothetical protein OH77DRAFT_1429010 [Trametes cingulata]|nr:hypothetical protein OH77DRAFT_1429010 [Trametes cingulata]
MASGLDIWNTALAVVGLLAIIGQLLYWIIKSRLPTARLRVLEDTLKETESLLSQCVEEGRLNNPAQAAEFHRNLGALRSQANDLRVETLSARTYADDFMNMMKGLSRRTKDLCEEVRVARAEISTSSSASLQRSSETGRTLTSPEADTRCSVGAESASSDSDSWRGPSIQPSPQRPSAHSTTANTSGHTGLHTTTSSPLGEEVGLRMMASWDSQTTLDAGTEPSGHGNGVNKLSYSSQPPALAAERPKPGPLSSARTRCTPSLRRKKQGGSASRKRDLARLARLSAA